MATPRKASIARAKLEAFTRAGTCRLCGARMIANELGVCRRCAPEERARIHERELARALNESAMAHFRYWVVVIKKRTSEDGRLARALLADRAFKRAANYEQVRRLAVALCFDPALFASVWNQSEAQRVRPS